MQGRYAVDEGDWGAKAYRFFPGGRRAKPGDVANNWEVELMLADQSADGLAEVLFKKTKEPYVKNASVRSWLLAAAVCCEIDFI